VGRPDRTQLERAPGTPSADRIAWTALAIAAVLSAALILWESRGNTFFNDEFAVFQRLGGGFDAETVFEPHNGHLVAFANLLYAIGFETVGPDHAAFRLVGLLGLLACTLLVFVYLRRRVDPLLALAPALVLLFLGASWEILLWPFSVATWGFALAAGVAALLLLERDDRSGDIGACVFLVAALASHSTGLAFLVGVAVYVLLRPDRRQRIWVVLVPPALYAAWWLWALKFDHDSPVSAVNAWLIPSFAADSLAAVSGAVTGLAAGLSGDSLNPTIQLELGWGRVIGLAVIVALVVRLVRGNVPRALWATLAILLALWAFLALGLGPGRTADQSRYIYPGAVLLFLVAGNAIAGIRVSRTAVAVVLAVAGLAVLTNVRQLHDGEAFLGDYSERVRAQLAMLELGGDQVPPDLDPHADAELADLVPPQLPIQAGPYLEAVDRFGAVGFTTAEVLEQDPPVREDADRFLARALGLTLTPSEGPGSGVGECAELASGGALELFPGTVEIVAEDGATVGLGRFADSFPVELGEAPPEVPVALAIPADGSDRPWRLALTSGSAAEVCEAG